MQSVVGALRVVLSMDSAAFERGLKSMQDKLGKAGKSMQSVGRTMSTYVTAPLAGMGALTLKVAGDFEASMNKVAGVTSATADELERLKNLAKEMGSTTQFTASQAADAMSFLAMAGFSVQETMDALPGTLQLAASAQMDLGRAADIVSNVLSGYGMEVSELGRVNDVLVKAFTASNTNLEQLGEAMTYAGPVASAAGASFEEVTAALGMMGNAGIQASMAGTSLRNAMSRILAPTKAMRGAMEEAGLSFVDAQGKLLPLNQIIEQLEPHADNAGLFMELFGQRAGPAMAALVSQGSDALRDLTGELENSAGTAERIGDVQMQGFNGAMRELTSAFEGLQLAIADSGLIEFMTEAVKSITGWVQQLSKTNPEMLKWGTVIAAVAAGLGPLVLTLGLFLTAISAISAPVLAVVAAVAAMAAGITVLYQGIQMAMPYIQELGGPIWESIKSGLQSVVDAINGFEQRIIEMVTQALTSLKGMASQMVQIGADMIAGLVQGIKSAPGAVRDALLSVVSGAWQSAKDFLGIRSPSRLFAQMGVQTMQGLGEGMESMAGNVQSIGESIAQTVASSFKGLIDGSKTVKDVLKDLLSQLSSVLMNNAFKSLFSLGGGGGGGGFFKSLFGGLLGFSRGGTILPGGSGGIDSQLVAFRKSPNERVDITKPGQTLTNGEQNVHVTVSVDDDGKVQAYVSNMGRQAAQAGAAVAVNQVKNGFPSMLANAQSRSL